MWETYGVRGRTWVNVFGSCAKWASVRVHDQASRGALELVCVAQGHVAGELLICLGVSVRAGSCIPSSEFPAHQA
jgi:hypothetical protein